MRVLLTGAAGSIGSVLGGGLADAGHAVLGLDLVVPEIHPGRPEGWYTVDCTDPDAVAAVFGDLDRSGGVDAVVHLAGLPDEAALRDELESHVVSTGVLLDAMVAHGVSRMVYAGSKPRRRAHPAHRPADDGCQATSRHVLRGRQGGRRGVAEPLRRPPRD